MRPEIPELGSGNDPADDPPATLDPTTQILLEAKGEERETFRRALILAVLAHVVLLWVTLPNLAAPKQLGAKRPSKVFVVQNLRFKPPVKRQQKQIPKRRVKRIPIPDPTPDDPEPLYVEELFEPPQAELPEIDAAVFGIPDAPPWAPAGPGGPMQIGDGVTAPQKIFAPQPRYTEEARQGRIQGTVILQAVIDEEGAVSGVEVLKGLPLGLNDAAIETVRQWRFKPATLDGAPVAVYLSLLINFSLQ